MIVKKALTKLEIDRAKMMTGGNRRMPHKSFGGRFASNKNYNRKGGCNSNWGNNCNVGGNNWIGTIKSHSK